MALANVAIQTPGELGLKLGPCGENVCVAWVMPAGLAWYDGARPGMRVVALNGLDARAAVGFHPLREAELLAPGGQSILARVMSEEMNLPFWASTSLWLTGALFALLGSVVLVRRPDAPVARLFAFFTGLTGVALGVSPASGGPHPAWALVVQFVSLLGVAATLPAFATAFVGDWSGPRATLRIFWLAGGMLLTGYLVSLFIYPSLYSLVRVAFAVYFVGSIVTALIVLARKMLLQHPSGSARDARLALTGIACGTLPFVGLTLIPQNVVHSDLAPGYVTAILWVAIPLTFAYAILRHQILGIRRLVHRGMVYGITAVITLAVLFLLILAIDSRDEGALRAAHPAWATAALLALGALLFHVLSHGAHVLVNRLLFHDEVDSGTLLAAMRSDLVGSAHVEEVVAAMVKTLRESLRLEAVVLFLGTTAETIRVAASAGSRADESIAHVRPRLLEMDLGEHGMTETRWNSDVLLIARLETGGHTLGFLVLGPKDRGEVFLREERRLV